MNNNVEGEIIKNELGVYYKFTTIRDNLFILIDCIYNAKVVYFPDFHPSKGRNLERNLPKLLFLLRNGQKKAPQDCPTVFIT